MADNFLEKRMEQYKARATSQGAARGASVAALIEKSCATEFDGFVVRADQLHRIVAAAVKVVSAAPFRYKLLCGNDAVQCVAGVLSPTACIAVYAPAECCSFALGRAVQAMLLQAAEIGLSGAVVKDFALQECGGLVPVALLAVGRAAEFQPLSACEVNSFIIE